MKLFCRAETVFRQDFMKPMTIPVSNKLDVKVWLC